MQTLILFNYQSMKVHFPCSVRTFYTDPRPVLLPDAMSHSKYIGLLYSIQGKQRILTHYYYRSVKIFIDIILFCR